MCRNVDRKHVKWIEINVTLTDMNATVTEMNVITTEKDKNERNKDGSIKLLHSVSVTCDLL